jgi:hypothetical protein
VWFGHFVEVAPSVCSGRASPCVSSFCWTPFRCALCFPCEFPVQPYSQEPSRRCGSFVVLTTGWIRSAMIPRYVVTIVLGFVSLRKWTTSPFPGSICIRTIFHRVPAAHALSSVRQFPCAVCLKAIMLMSSTNPITD